MKEWCSGAHSVFENGSERVSELIFSLMSESWAKLKKLMSVEHVANKGLFNIIYNKVFLIHSFLGQSIANFVASWLKAALSLK